MMDIVKPRKKKRSFEENREETSEAAAAAAEAAEVILTNTKKKMKKLDGHWKYLDLLLFINNDNFNLQRKLDVAFEFVNAMKLKEAEVEKQQPQPPDDDDGMGVVSYPRLIAILIDWIQRHLIPKEGVKEAQLDYRYWEIFKFCLDKSLCVKVHLMLKSKLLDTFYNIGTDALSILKTKKKKERKSLCERSELYSLIEDCASLVFNCRWFNAEPILWSKTASKMLALVYEIYLVDDVCKDDDSASGASLLRLSASILEPFANVLRVNPNPKKKTFHYLVNEILKPSVSLLVLLNAEIDGSDNNNNSPMTSNLLNIVEEILSNGLFHPTYVEEFLSAQSTEKKRRDKQTTENQSTENDMEFSDIKRFFEKLEEIRQNNKQKMSTLGGVGDLFRLFVIRVKKQKRVPVLSKSITMNGETEVSVHLAKNHTSSESKISVGNGIAVIDTNYSSKRHGVETGESLFHYFIRYIEPLMLDIKMYSESNLDEEPMLLNAAHCTLQATNKILATFMHEKIYLRTEDTYDGARLKLLKNFYEILILFSLKFHSLWLSSLKTDSLGLMEMLPLVGKEIIVSLGHFLEIEYEIVGDDLVSLWSTMFSYLAIDLSSVGTPERSSLASPILHLSCQLIDIYSDLRQVSNPVFALCKAVRLFGVLENVDDEYSMFGSCTHSLSPEARVKSVTTLLSFQQFRHAICKAIKSIPEGQANGCIRKLKMDISESIDWVKASCSKHNGKNLGEPLRSCSMQNSNLQPELLGMALSELYTIVLDYLAVTTGNSVVVEKSIKDLMEVLGPSLCILVGKHVDGVNEFLCSSSTGRTWVSMFFFRVYVSCRSLYRQSISRMPPDSSRNASEALGDLFGYSGKDCTRNNEWRDEGYFSWIVKPSKSLSIILQSVLDFLLENKQSVSDFSHGGTVSGYGPVVYVMHTMAYQRLVDLSRRIKGLEFLREGTVRQVEMKLTDDANLHLYRNKINKWEEHISELRLEAKNVTSFLLRDLALVVEKVESIFSDPRVTSEGKVKHEDDAWDLGIPSLTEKSLSTAVWYLLCKNTDIWCSHAKKKQLKEFLFLLFRLFLAGARGSCKNVIKHKMDKPQNLVEVTLHKISLELLHDTCFYEETSVCRHVASIFCCVLKTSVPQQLRAAWSDVVDFSEWLEVLRELEKKSVVLLSGRQVANDEMKLGLLPSDSSSTKYSKELKSCQQLLNLLCWMPKGYLSLKSLKVYATHILNLERVLVLSLLNDHSELKMDNHYELFRLFLCCRKALKSLLMAFCEETTKVREGSIIPLFSESSDSVLWLLNSVSVLLQFLPALPEEHASQVKYMSFSLMDHTSSVLQTLTKKQFCLALPSLIYNGKPIAELPISEGLRKHNLCDSDPSLGAWMEHITESLKERARILLSDEKLNAGLSVVDLNNLSCIISCFQGFLWGITYILRTRNKKFCQRVALRYNLMPFIGFFEKFINSCFQALLFKDSRQHDGSYNGRMLEPDSENGFSRLASTVWSSRVDLLSGHDDDHEKIHSSENKFVEASGIQKKRLKSNSADFAVNIFSEVGSYKRQSLKIHLLQSLLKGDNPEVAISVRQLFLGSSAILSLRLQIYNENLSSSLMSIPIETSQVLLMELAKMVEEPHSFSYLWLDGVVKYLEFLGSYISSISSTSSLSVYSGLIDMHLRVIGRCISLQGKGTTLASREMSSNTKTLMGHIGSSELSLGQGKYSLDEFRARIGMSFKVLINKPLQLLRKKPLESKKDIPLELHLSTVIKALESKLVGVYERLNMTYEVNTGGPDGGKVSPTVAAGIDCFDLVLESVLESKHPNLLKGHIRTSIDALFNVILHLQGQLIFYKKLAFYNGDFGPDAGAVILMCVEVLTKVAGKPALFKMDFSHVVQSLRVPAALFQDFCHLKSSLSPSNSLMLSTNLDLTPVEGMLTYKVDQQFSVDLFAACCKLLSTVVKHHEEYNKYVEHWESEQCISILQDSVRVLLQCLEMKASELVEGEVYSALQVQEGILCASFLRRIYEEIKVQKKVIGRYTSHFLSNYICVYSGYGPSKTGIRREIDEALRPGVYALVDACTLDDLQKLHTVLGEGPCRNTLATLQHDYKLNYKFEGKV